MRFRGLSTCFFLVTISVSIIGCNQIFNKQSDNNNAINQLAGPEDDLSLSNTIESINSQNAETYVADVIGGKFQHCQNGLTYTTLGSKIYEIEGFGSRIVKFPNRPTYIESKNNIIWCGSVTLLSKASRHFDILNSCWSTYSQEFDGKLFELINEGGNWNNLSGLDGYKKPTCKEITEFLVVKKICGR